MPTTQLSSRRERNESEATPSGMHFTPRYIEHLVSPGRLVVGPFFVWCPLSQIRAETSLVSFTPKGEASGCLAGGTRNKWVEPEHAGGSFVVPSHPDLIGTVGEPVV